MRTKTILLFQFSELSEQAKKKAIEVCNDYNVSYDWWEFVYSDAQEVGIKIQGFELYRGNEIEGKFIEGAEYTADKILSEHGDQCSTYKTALSYQTQFNELVKKYSDGITTNKVAEGNENEFDEEADELQTEFLKDILDDYLTMLHEEYEYLTTEEAVIETIEANEYEFTEDGERI